MRPALVLAVFTAACAPSPPPARPASKPPPTPPAKPACRLEADFPLATADAKKAAVAAFRAANPGEWSIDPTTFDVDPVFGYITRATRTDSAPAGPKGDAEAIGRAFFEKNAASFGFEVADLKRARYIEGTNGSDLAYDAPMPGFESYDTAPFRTINVFYTVADNAVRELHSLGSMHPRSLELCSAAPPLPSLAGVIGQDLFRPLHDPPEPMGKVDLASIKERDSVVFEEVGATKKRYVVGWRLTVAKSGAAWMFVVSAADGSLLARTN